MLCVRKRVFFSYLLGAEFGAWNRETHAHDCLRQKKMHFNTQKFRSDDHDHDSDAAGRCGGEAAARSSIRPSDAKYERWLWDVLEAGSDADRAAFLAFATGRSRLPVSVRAATAGGGSSHGEPVLLLDMDGESSETRVRLPTSSTCSYTFHLVRTPSAEALRERLLRAIYECTSIDRDRAGAGGDARHPIEAAAGELPPPEQGGAVVDDGDDADDADDPRGAAADDGPESVPLFRVPPVRAEGTGDASDAATEEAEEDEDASEEEDGFELDDEEE
jgi:hypothetical protein